MSNPYRRTDFWIIAALAIVALLLGLGNIGLTLNRTLSTPQVAPLPAQVDSRALAGETGFDSLAVGRWLQVEKQSALTVSAGAPITPTGSYMPITSGVTPLTTSTTIPVVAGTDAGQVLILHNTNVTATITVDGTGGTVECGADVALVGGDVVSLMWDGADWRCTGFRDNTP